MHLTILCAPAALALVSGSATAQPASYAGGKWDPDAWAQLFVNAGARIAGVQMEHHDGFALWDSKVNEWNSLSKGPMLNLAKLHVDAFRKQGLKIMAAFHHAYNFQGYWQNVPKQTDPSLQKLYGQLSGPNTWGYVAGMTYYNPAAIIHQFIDRVSKNGNLLLNICPMADGTIPKEQQDTLMAIGTFLKQFGTAIYETRAWTVYGEGPTKMGGCSICAPTSGTSQDVRYTRSKDGDAVYALLLGWPGNGKQVNLTSVTTSRFALGSGKVFLFAPVGGSATSLQFTDVHRRQRDGAWRLYGWRRYG